MIVLSAMCLLLNHLTQIDFKKLKLFKDKPEFTAQGFEVKIFQPTGGLLYRVTAESGMQYPDDDKIHLYNFDIHEYSKQVLDLETVHVEANDGWLNEKDQTYFLGQNINLTINNADPKKVIVIKTKNVNIDGVKQIADNNDAFIASSDKSSLSGVGFTIDYKNQTLFVKSRVKVIYEK